MRGQEWCEESRAGETRYQAKRSKDAIVLFPTETNKREITIYSKIPTSFLLFFCFPVPLFVFHDLRDATHCLICHHPVIDITGERYAPLSAWYPASLGGPDIVGKEGE